MPPILRSLIMLLAPPLLVVVGYQVLVHGEVCRQGHEQCVWAVGLSYIAGSAVLACISVIGLALFVRDCLDRLGKRRRP